MWNSVAIFNIKYTYKYHFLDSQITHAPPITLMFNIILQNKMFVTHYRVLHVCKI